ncbi:protein phosphatase 1 regulatory subunit 36 [Pseudoscourfieldia marina]
MAEASFTAPPASASSSLGLARDDGPPPVGVAANRPIGDSMGGNGVSSSRASFRPGDGRATSPGGSTRGRISVEKAQLGGGARLDLLRIKTKVERQMDETMPTRLKRFCQTDLCTNLLSSLLMYLVSHFLTEVAQRREAREKEQMEKGAGAFPDNTAGRKSSSEIAEERDYHLHCVGETYARVVVGNKDLSQDTQKERMFWEELLRFLNLAMAEAFVDQRHNAEIERELGRIFRGSSFNLTARQQEDAARSAMIVDRIPLKELYARKTDEDVLRSRRFILDVRKKPTLSEPLTALAAQRTPLLRQLMPTPKEVFQRAMAARAADALAATQAAADDAAFVAPAPSEVGTPRDSPSVEMAARSPRLAAKPSAASSPRLGRTAALTPTQVRLPVLLPVRRAALPRDLASTPRARRALARAEGADRRRIEQPVLHAASREPAVLA